MVELIMVQILMLRRKINMEAFYASSGVFMFEGRCFGPLNTPGPQT